MTARGWLWVAVVTLSFLSGPYLAEGAATVTIDPRSAVTVRVNGIRQFTAMVSGATNGSVTWSLTPPSGVSASAIGSIDASGTYTAPPTTLPGFASLTVTARSIEQPTATASTTITVLNRVPSVSAVSPPSLPVGAFSLSVSGTKFVRGAQVKWNGVPLSTTFGSASQLTATGTAAQVGSVALTVANPGPGAESDAFSLTVTSKLTVSVTPSSANVTPGGTTTFQAVVGGSPNQGVVWSVAGGAVNGVIDTAGRYTAPGVGPVAGLVTVYAIAAADGVTRGSATVSIQDPQAITSGRFLEQSTFGPTPGVRANGSNKFLVNLENWRGEATTARKHGSHQQECARDRRLGDTGLSNAQNGASNQSSVSRCVAVAAEQLGAKEVSREKDTRAATHARDEIGEINTKHGELQRASERHIRCRVVPNPILEIPKSVLMT
jgi:hypothetical protein